MAYAPFSVLALVWALGVPGVLASQEVSLQCHIDGPVLSRTASDSLVALARRVRDLGQDAAAVVTDAVAAKHGSYEGPGPGQFYASAARMLELAARFAPVNYWAWHELAETELQLADRGEGKADSTVVRLALRFAECARRVAVRDLDSALTDSAEALLARARRWPH